MRRGPMNGLRARFLSYRLNIPSADSSEVVLTVEDWKAIIARPVPPRDGRPIVGVDIGASRAWSAAVAAWRNGRVEALAVAPGVPSLEEQEIRDRQPAGTYSKAGQRWPTPCGVEGIKVPPPSILWDCHPR